MKNVIFRIEGEKKAKKLIIEVDLSQRLGPSRSGKTDMIASTSGNADTGVDGIRVGLNVFVKRNGEAVKGGK
jgi:hypothetical protein